MTDAPGQPTPKQRVIVMTGATSGIGAETVKHLAAEPGARVIVGAFQVEQPLPDNVQVLPFDLTSLASVRTFAEALEGELGTTPIDVLILNAGLQSRDNQWKTEEGYERTFGGNHLAHYLLTRLLLPSIADHGVIMTTTSDTHDPSVAPPVAPKSLDVAELAHPTKKVVGVRAYAASKLCIMMTALYLARQQDIEDRDITVIAFSPGLVDGTSLGRDQSVIARIFVRTLINTVFRVIGLFRADYSAGTPAKAGAQQAKLALGQVPMQEGRVYVTLIKSKPEFPDPSALARDEAAQDRLWRESAELVGLG